MKNKKAWLPSKELIELILAAAVIFVLIFVLVSLLVVWNPEDETAKSYLDSLNKEIAKADDGGVGEFEIWQPEGREEGKYLLIYFGDNVVYTTDDGKGSIVKYSPKKIQKNNLCVCYTTETYEGVCDSCVSLKYPVESDKDSFVFGEKMQITKPKGEDKYVFKKV